MVDAARSVSQESAQREYTELTRWTADKRILFRDIHVAANDWPDLLRRAERAFHSALYEAALLCGAEVCDLVDETEDELLRLTAALGRATDYLPAADPEHAAQAAAAALVEDFPALRDRLMSAMRSEQAGRSTPKR
ncbi:hypothetical protein SAMN05421837_11459 [Amycolatopsis pretoriensis]|uniref:Uncharacterized protein n=1 Tax=Amycolatopsis pretoriensis TaxID=218821 RepID=A0A1H5RGU8_9PSEU|nr:hypothetical protein [Amycolatopsis pretoriensis]SEF37499.1 hypothetical protein SAMN05421837_11459 [Amycolatopsis pretoriensis]